MKATDIKIGGEYAVKLDGRLQLLEVLRESVDGGWIVMPFNVKCERRIPDARQFHSEIPEEERGYE